MKCNFKNTELKLFITLVFFSTFTLSLSPKKSADLKEPRKGCPEGFFPVGADCFFLYNGTKETFLWSESRRVCQSLHPEADLATISDQRTQDYFTSLLPFVTSSAWIGLRNEGHSFKWVLPPFYSSSSVDFFNWAHYDLEGGDAILQNVSEICVFLSTATVRIGTWEVADCSTQKLGFLCQAPASIQRLSPSASLPIASISLEQLTGNNFNTCLPGYLLYLGTCYRLADRPPSLQQASVVSCRRADVTSLQFSTSNHTLEHAFLRFLMTRKPQTYRAGDQVDEIQEFNDSLCSHPVMDNKTEKRPLIDNHPCQGLPSSSRWFARNGTSSCYTLTTIGTGSGLVNASSACENVNAGARLASIHSVEEQLFVSLLIEHAVGDLWLGGFLQQHTPVVIKWLDGTPYTGYSNFNPRSQHLIDPGLSDPRSSLCLLLEHNSGWWISTSCEGDPGKVGVAVCKIESPIAEVSINSSEPKVEGESPQLASGRRKGCPKGYIAIDADVRTDLVDGPATQTCYQLHQGNRLNHAQDWRSAERRCADLSANFSGHNQSFLWKGNLASLPDSSSASSLLYTLKRMATGQHFSSNNVNIMPAHLVRTSELVWIGLSRNDSSDSSWNKWTNGASGQVDFYNSQLQASMFVSSGGFFDSGNCIALHLISGTWYSLRCSLDLGYLCQINDAVATDSISAALNAHIDTPVCRTATPPDSVDVDSSGFIHDASIDCESADGFTYYNSQCFRAIDDKFLSYSDAQAYCKSLVPIGSANSAGLAILHSDADQMFVASLLSELPKLPVSVPLYGKLSSISRLEAAWRRYHWLGLFYYRHSFHTVDETVACYTPHEASAVISSIQTSQATCFSMIAPPEMNSFGLLSADVECTEKLPFVCSFRPHHLASPKRAAAAKPELFQECPDNYTLHRTASGTNCYRVASHLSVPYAEASRVCTEVSSDSSRLASLYSPHSIAWIRAHLPLTHVQAAEPHWIGLRLPAQGDGLRSHATLSWTWESGAPVTHTEWAQIPDLSSNAGKDICFAFSKSLSASNYELDMVAVDCNRRLSPLCEADSLSAEDAAQEADEDGQEEKVEECSRTLDQQDYSGFLNTTATGKRCIRWDLLNDLPELSKLHEDFHVTSLQSVAAIINYKTVSLSPRQRLTSPAYLPALSAASNWCRNPNGKRNHAFCYVQSPSGTPAWDYCAIPICAVSNSKIPTSIQYENVDKKPASSSKNRMLTYFLLCLCLVVILGGVVIYAVQKRRGSAFFRRRFWLHDSCCSRDCWLSVLLLRRSSYSRQPCLLSDNVTFDNQSINISV